MSVFMNVIYGYGFYGKIGTLNKQWVETNFFHVFFFPIYPINSILVTEQDLTNRKGIEIALNKKSIFAAYARLIALVMAIWMLYTAGHDVKVENQYLIDNITGILWLVLWIYLCFFYGRPNLSETITRCKVGTSTGLYILPEWLDFKQAREKYSLFLIEYKKRYPNTDWKSELSKGNNIEFEKLPILYALALFNCMIADSPENEKLYYQADKLYQLPVSPHTMV